VDICRRESGVLRYLNASFPCGISGGMALLLILVLALAAAAAGGPDNRRLAKECAGSPICTEQDWPSAVQALGQPSGADVLPSGDVVIFHRGDRIWDANSFDDG